MGGIFKRLKEFFLPLLLLIFYTFSLFWPYIQKGLVPVPGDILLGHYHPWVDNIWQEKVAGYPIRNFILFDGVRQTLPWRLLAVEQFKSGQWPLWDPYIFSGTPLLGNLQTAALYPLNFLFFLFPALDAWTIYLSLQPVLAGILAFWFLRTLKCSRISSLMAGICWGFSLIMMNHLEFGIDGHTALWLPLSLGAINEIWRTGKFRWTVVLVIAFAMSLLGGYPPPAYYSLGITLFYALFKFERSNWKRSLLIALGALVAFCLIAAQFFPSLDLGRRVVREEVQFGVLSDEPYFFPFENLTMLVAPDFFGHPATGNFSSKVYYSDNPSVGVIGFLFVFFSLGWIFKKKEVTFWWLVVILPTSLMLKTPLGEGLRHIPVAALSLVTPMRMIWVVAFALAVLAGLGMERFTFLLAKKKRLWSILAPIAIVWEIIFLVCGLAFLLPQGEHIKVAQRNLVLPILFLGTASFVLCLCLFWPRIWRWLGIAILALTGGELVRQGVKYNTFISKETVFPPTAILRQIQAEGKEWRTLITHPELLPVNSNVPYHLPMIDGYAPIYDGRYGQMIHLMNAPKNLEKVEAYPRIVFQTEYQSPLVDALNVRWILALRDLNHPKLKLIAREGQTRLYENLRVGPKAFFAEKHWVEKTDLEIARRILMVDLKREVVLEKEPMGLRNPGGNTEPGEVEVVNYQDNEISLKTRILTDGVLVLADSFDPGWKVFIDGKEKELLRADYFLRAVVVPAGSYEVKFIYDSQLFKIGLYTSGASLAAIVLGSIFVYRFRREQW